MFWSDGSEKKTRMDSRDTYQVKLGKDCIFIALPATNLLRWDSLETIVWESFQRFHIGYTREIMVTP